LKKEPFLYVNNDTVGITYTLRTSFYGNLNRIYIPKDARACESFLAKYCWYKKYNSKNLVDAKLTNYQSKFSSIKYLDGDVELNKTDLYISGGIGTTDYSFRWFNKPSINFYRLYKK